MQLKSHAHIEHIINGHRVTGWAEDDPPYEIETEDAAEFKEGQDGGLYGLGRPRLGCIFTYKVEPTSPTAQWAMQQEQMRKNAHKDRSALRTYQATHSDPVQGVSWTLAGGAILMIPPMAIANQTFEFRIRFEEITASVDGGVFHAPLNSAAA